MEAQIKYLLPSFAQYLFVIIFLHLSFNGGHMLLNDGDTGIHIRAGNYMLETRSIPENDPFSVVAPPLRWPTHEWFSDLIMAAVMKASGLTGVVIFFIFVIACTYSMLFRMLRSNRGNILIDTAFVFAVLIMSQFHWLARPHIFTLLLLVVWYHVLESFQNERNNYLYVLPPIMLFWVNLHGGFIIGFVVLGIYVVHNVIRFYLSTGAEKGKHLKKMKYLILAAMASFLVSLVNPEGFHTLLFPFDVVSNRLIMDNYGEFLSPNFHYTEFAAFKYSLLFTIAFLGVFGARLNFLEIVLILVFTNMSLFSCRYIPLFAIIVAPILSRHGDLVLGRTNHRIKDFIVRKSRGYQSIDESSRGYIWPIAAVMVVAVLAASNKIAFTFDESRSPVAAVAFLNKEHLPGNVFNYDEFGDYMIFAADPQYKVFYDSRADVHGREKLKDYLNVSHIKVGLNEIFEKYHINWIIFKKDSPVARYIDLMDDWKIIYSDKLTNIYMKNIKENEYWIKKYGHVKSSKG